ncbi:MAG: hypothetical protein OEZ06_14230 [Myxococcales bacterium]|nr:hypothetical protein [Myxococcales bacterium]
MTAPRTTIPIACLLLASLLLGGCFETGVDPSLPSPDRERFESEIWPILLRDCGFGACHGSPERFFRVVGPGHIRLDPETRTGDPVTAAELNFSYDRTRSMLDAEDPEGALLLRKPLSVEAGGAGHEGTDEYGRDIYPDASDPRYQMLADWARSAGP